MSSFTIHPDFRADMIKQLGSSAYGQFEKSLSEDSPTSIRLNSSKIQSNPFSGQPIPWCPEGFLLENRPVFTLDPAFHAGAYYVQEASSMFISEILRQLDVPKGIFLDIAAAPGGKSTLFSSYLGQEGLLLSNEVIKNRSLILKENIIKWGLGNTVICQNDPAHFSELAGFFDLVLLDAPCSGEGMFRKDPASRCEWSPDHVRFCAARQQRILDQTGNLVRAGGYFLYSTCTYNEQENEEMIRFLTTEFSYEPVQIDLQESWGIEESLIQTDAGVFYGYRFYPHCVSGEGFFIAVLKRPEDAFSFAPKKMKAFNHPALKQVDEQESRDLDDTLGFSEGAYYQLQDTYFRVSPQWKLAMDYIFKTLTIRYLGTELGKKMKKEWIPSHDWAVSVLPKTCFPKLPVSKTQALAYLRKEPLSLALDDKGWILLTYQDLPLGWIKNLENRINNYYPSTWRIRHL